VAGHAVGGFVQIGAAAREQDVVAVGGVLEDVEDRLFARRRRPDELPRGRVYTVEVARPPGVQMLLAVVQVEGVEVDALAALDLLDARI
jgi:hypothetical protein